MNSTTAISSIEDFIGRVRADRADWPHAWFRGEPNVSTALVPKLYRSKADGRQHDENRLLQFFRMKAPTFSQASIPVREATDQWLFLAQHVGLPTRLLDWTEGALVGLHFALLEKEPIVWMLNPIALNRLSSNDMPGGGDFPLTWFQPENGINIGVENIRGAWQLDGPGLKHPVAIHPTNIHPRMSVQRSCFTIHGKCKASLKEMLPPTDLRQYTVDPQAAERLRSDLQVLGISHSTVFPDLDGLAKDLAELF
jgi:hypothetical protein